MHQPLKKILLHKDALKDKKDLVSVVVSLTKVKAKTLLY